MDEHKTINNVDDRKDAIIGIELVNAYDCVFWIFLIFILDFVCGINIGQTLRYRRFVSVWNQILSTDLFCALALGLRLAQLPYVNLHSAFRDLIMAVFESRADCNSQMLAARTERNS